MIAVRAFPTFIFGGSPSIIEGFALTVLKSNEVEMFGQNDAVSVVRM